MIAILLISLTLYLSVFQNFFQHDEWPTFARWIYTSDLSILQHLGEFFKPNVAHYTPVAVLLYYLEYRLFGLHFDAYAVASVLSHVVIVYLVFIFVKQFTKQKNTALLTALLFGVNSAGFQTTSWMAASTNTHISTIFALLSMIFIGKYYRSKVNKNLLFSITFFVLSLLTKEISIGLFVILPLLSVFYIKKFTQIRKLFLISFLLGIIYLAFRFSMINANTLATQAHEFTPNSQSPTEIIYNIVSFPAKVTTQSIIPPRQLIEIGNRVAPILDITSQATVETKLIELLSWTFFVVVLLAVWKMKSRLAFFALAFVVINSFVYAISPGRVGIISLVDSRNLYFPAIGTALLLSLISFQFMKVHKTLVVVGLAIWIILQSLWLRHELSLAAETGKTRENILYEIKRLRPDLPENVVIYMQSDTAFYGMPEEIPPFETGLGQALLVWYNETEHFPKSFYEDHFLQYILDEGYRQSENRGFGYVRNYARLKQTLDDNEIPTSAVIAFKYERSSNTVTDITNEIQEQLNYGR